MKRIIYAKKHKPSVMMTLSLCVFVLNIILLPFLGVAPADPWWILYTMPLTYWISIILTLIACLMALKFNKTIEAWIYILLLTALLWSIPKLMFSNPIWTDTFLFLVQCLHIIRYGHVGSVQPESPGLALLASQLSIIMGTSDEIQATFFSSLYLPIFTVLAMYLLGIQLLNKRGAFTAILSFFAIFWFGLYFNKSSFAYALHILTLSSLLKSLNHRKPENSIIFMVIFIALTITYPSSILIPLALMGMALLMFVLSIAKSSKFIASYATFKTTTTTFLATSVIWISWHIWLGPTSVNLIIAIKESLSELISGEPVSEAIGVFYSPNYTPQYLPIVNLRLFLSLGTLLLGVVLSFIYFIISTHKLVPFFMSSLMLLLFVAGIYFPLGGRGIHGLGIRAVFLSIPLTAVFIALFIEQSEIFPKFLKNLCKLLRIILLTMVCLFMLIIPLLMYSHMAFVYPPNSDIVVHEFIMRYGVGYAAILGGHTITDYYMFKFNTNLSPYPFHEDVGPGDLLTIDKRNYNIIVTTFRMYTKDAFVEYKPNLISCMENLRSRLMVNSSYYKVYQADNWHEAYFKAN